MKPDLDRLSNDELVELYSSLIKKLKERKVIYSNNLIGNLGEHLATIHYSGTRGLPNLQKASPNTENIDAISTKGKRYSIKTTTGKVTGVFYGLNSLGSTDPEEKKFEYVLIVILDKDFALSKIIEITWEQFLKIKRWHSRMNAWNISVNKELEQIGNVVYCG